MLRITPYLSFDGRCAEAMRFYERVLGGTLAPMTMHSDAPAQARNDAAADAGGVMHARLDLPNGAALMAGDVPPQMPHRPMSGIRVTLELDTAAEAQRVFGQLAEGAAVDMPLQPTFWAEAFGMLTDRFGTPWIVNGAMKS
jgi:PhnB protein